VIGPGGLRSAVDEKRCRHCGDGIIGFWGNGSESDEKQDAGLLLIVCEHFDDRSRAAQHGKRIRHVHLGVVCGQLHFRGQIHFRCEPVDKRLKVRLGFPMLRGRGVLDPDSEHPVAHP